MLWKIYFICSFCFYYCMECRTPALLNLRNIVVQKKIWVMHMRKKNKKQQDSKLATSLWVSTSFWESLPIADQKNFSSFFFMSLTWALHEYFFYFQMFFIVFDHANTCECKHKHAVAGRSTQHVQLAF